jgi:hypothetical protein
MAPKFKNSDAGNLDITKKSYKILPLSGKVKVVDFIKGKKRARHQWLTPVILTTQEAGIERLWLEASPGKQFTRPHFQNN